MELDSIKLQLRELQQCYDDDTKSDDDIIYLVYNWVKSAHVVAQLLLLEGRFPELRRCLDLCQNVLQEEHVGASSGKLGGSGSHRKVISRAVGEDRSLMDALHVRTLQLQKQCEEARMKFKGRDTQYYMNKLLRAGVEEGARGGTRNTAVGGERRPPTPPERGISFGRLTRCNRWKVPPVLPPLVTETKPFFCGRTSVGVDGFSDVPSRRWGSSPHVTYSSVPLESGVRLGDALSQAAVLSAEEDRPVDLTRGGESASSTGVPQHLLLETLDVAASNAPLPEKAVWQYKAFVHGKHVRPLSAGVNTAPQLSGEVEPRSRGSVDSRVVRTAIAIKTATEAQQRSMAAMQAMTGPSPLFLQQDEQQPQREGPEQLSAPRTDSRLGNGKRGAGKGEDRDAFSGVWRLGTSSQSSFSIRSTRGKDTLLPKRLQRLNSPILSLSKTLEHSNHQSCEMNNTLGTMDLLQSRSAEVVEAGSSALTCHIRKESLKASDFYPCLSLDAKAKVEDIYNHYKEKRSELRLSMRAIRRKVGKQRDLFKPHEQVVLLEDPAVWKARRRHPAVVLDSFVTAGPSIPEVCRLSATNTLDSRSFLSVSGAVRSDCLSLAAASANATSLGKTDTSDDVAFSTECALQPTELEHNTSHLSESGLASRGHHGTSLVIGEGRDGDKMFSPGVGKPTFSSSSSITRTAPRYIDVMPSMLELRLARLNSSTCVAFPIVHAMVTRRTAARVEQEKNLKQFGSVTLPSHISVFLPGSSHPLTEGGVGRQNMSSTALQPLSLTPETQFVVVGQKEKGGTRVSDAHAGQEGGRDHAVAMPLSLEEIRRCSDLVLMDAAALEMSLPFHLATVRLQCACRRFLAKRERSRRSAAVEEYLNSMVLRGKSAIIIQRNVRCWLVRRKMSTVAMRLGYKVDQQVANDDIYSEDTGPDDTGNGFGVAPLGWRTTSAEMPLTTTVGSSLSSLPLESLQESPDYQRQMQISLSPVASGAFKLYNIPSTIRFKQPPTRTARLRRIQENIACRVIVRVFRNHLNRAIKYWEEETRTYISYATGRLKFMEAFGVPWAHSQQCVDGAGRIGSTTEKPMAFDLSQSMSFCSSVFPLSPERVSGDVVAAWEARMAEARRWGEFMTPLEQVKLSELLRVLRKRQEAEAVQRREQEELWLQEKEEIQQRQRVKVNAVLLIQRCARGCRFRQWFAKKLQMVREGQLIHHRRAELLDGNKVGLANPHIANVASSLLLSFSAMGGKSIPSEAQPVPPEVAAVIMKGIYRRHPMRFGVDEGTRRKQLLGVVTVQCFLRFRASQDCVIDRYIELCAIVIQRQWRLVLKRRKVLKKAKRKRVVNTLQAMGA
ncbi:hypothetical protein TraAM80_03014 [Trypanosoma rangeli]|uniref:IQ calmodulin-binding motif containing protein n=1 Tax=Trypanosoma rangeli TaxID=5698 RepID=A0A3R7NKU7_TRYRA|nr:uncharacterized protein TraAM80_03014 [Trypanosoma rangeli]RNF07969.1 hypothetical protein TraAM80_03014 [Trypanosoma rangeli]|eukprot:RNF07969.1 hypothetical protein TraAM80_03014 [Trypanosoma rangeli]